MLSGRCVEAPGVRLGDCSEHDAVGALALMSGEASLRQPATADNRFADVEPPVQGRFRVKEMCEIASSACIHPITRVSVMLLQDVV